jgi:tetratricopeptide (TPR) repeat protein
MDMSEWQIRGGWFRMSQVAAVLVMMLCPPPLVSADSTDNWQVLTEAGVAAREQARYEEAEGLFLLAGHETKRFDPDDPRVAATLNHLGLVYHAQGQYARAKPYYEQALNRWERAFGSDHADVASALHNLADIYLEEGAFEQAEAYYWRSLAIGERVLGRGHPELAVGYNSLASLYRKQGRLAQAEAKFRLALALLQGSDGAGPVDPAPILNNLAALTGTILGNWASLLHERGLVDEAKLRYERALIIQQQTLGRDHPILAVILYRYAGLLRDIGQRLEAGLVANRAAAIRTQQTN